MGDNKIITIALKIAYTTGFVLHVLSILFRMYLILYGPIQFISLIPYMLMEAIFLLKSIKEIFVSSARSRTAWVKTFAMINSLLFLLLFIICIFYSRLIKRFYAEEHESPTWNIVKVIWIIFLSGPLVTNSAFLGITYLSISKKSKEVPNIPWVSQSKDLYLPYESGVLTSSTDAPTQYSLHYIK